MALAEYWYNTNYHSALEMTPFQALYGIPPPIHIPYLPRDSSVAAEDQMLREKEDMLKVLKFQLRKSQVRMKSQADIHRSERSF